jgi:hypothetical protein
MQYKSYTARGFSTEMRVADLPLLELSKKSTMEKLIVGILFLSVLSGSVAETGRS